MIYNTFLHTLARAFKFEMLVHVLCIFMLVLALALVLVLVLVRVDAGTGRLKSCYSNAQPSRLPLQPHGHTATCQTDDGHRPSNHCIKTATRPQAQLKTATGQRDDGHRPSNHGSRSWLGCRDCG